MCSQVAVDQFCMSNSEIFVIKDHQETKFEVSKRPRSEFQDECHLEEEEGNRDHDDESGTVNSLMKDEVVVVVHNNEQEEEEEDGFKTPTSLDNKIPVEIECPPAPRKPKPSRKRKASSSSISNRPRVLRLLDHSRVVESLYERHK